MRNRPAISVLTSVYNGERFLAECIESILGQSFGDFEFLIIDDGSTDGSLEILRGYERQDRRIRLATRPNRGVPRSLNELFFQSAGEFIARIDADDVAMPNRFRVQLDALHADPALVCTGGFFQMIDARGRALTVLKPPTDDAEIQRQALAGNGSICHSTAMIRRTAMEQIGGYCEDFETAQDLDLWLRLGEVGKLANLPETVLQFRLHEASISEVKRYEQRQSARIACERAWQRRGIVDGVFEASEPWRPGKDSTSRLKFALLYGWWAFNSGERRTALHYGMRAVEAAPTNKEAWRLLVCAAVKPMKMSFAAEEASPALA
jgi:glycosyltransferase involved in cell wall biosynthesis